MRIEWGPLIAPGEGTVTASRARQRASPTIGKTRSRAGHRGPINGAMTNALLCGLHSIILEVSSTLCVRSWHRNRLDLLLTEALPRRWRRSARTRNTRCSVVCCCCGPSAVRRGSQPAAQGSHRRTRATHILADCDRSRALAQRRGRDHHHRRGPRHQQHASSGSAAAAAARGRARSSGVCASTSPILKARSPVQYAISKRHCTTTSRPFSCIILASHPWLEHARARFAKTRAGWPAVATTRRPLFFVT